MEEENLSFQLKVFDKAVKKIKDTQLSKVGGHIVAVIHHFRMIYNIEINDDAG